MPREMGIAILVNVIAFTVVYGALLLARIEVAVAEERVTTSEKTAGDAVKPPRLSEIGDV
jgi:hypothetical protein